LAVQGSATVVKPLTILQVADDFCTRVKAA